jgi:outer membrane protein assembly factor BamB
VLTLSGICGIIWNREGIYNDRQKNKKKIHIGHTGTFKDGADYWGTPVIADLDGDGRMEILMSLAADGMVHCYDGKTGEEKWSAAMPDGSYASSMVMKDLNGDGKPEAVFGTSAGNVYIMDGGGNFLWECHVGGGIGHVQLGDIDGDGKDEILVYNAWTGNLHCLKYNLSEER